MKILVISNMLDQKHFDLIKTEADKIGADVFFYKNEQEIPQNNYDADLQSLKQVKTLNGFVFHGLELILLWCLVILLMRNVYLQTLRERTVSR